MKTIYIVRHAKSSWKYRQLRDFERPLKKRGINDAHTMAAHLKEKSIEPDLFISSPAKRALETANIFAETLGFPEDQVQENISIYGASTEELMTVIWGLDDQYQSVMIFGHDPTLTNIATYLTKKPFEKVPTSAVVAIDFEVDAWSKINKTEGNLRFFIYPKMLV